MTGLYSPKPLMTDDSMRAFSAFTRSKISDLQLEAQLYYLNFPLPL